MGQMEFCRYAASMTPSWTRPLRRFAIRVPPDIMPPARLPDCIEPHPRPR